MCGDDKKCYCHSMVAGSKRIEVQRENKESGFDDRNLVKERDLRRTWKSDFGESFYHPNLIPLGYGKAVINFGFVQRQNLDKREQVEPEHENGPMDLVLEGENNLLNFLEGKKRQRLVGDVETLPDNDIRRGTNEKSASSTMRSNRTQ